MFLLKSSFLLFNSWGTNIQSINTRTSKISTTRIQQQTLKEFFSETAASLFDNNKGGKNKKNNNAVSRKACQEAQDVIQTFITTLNEQGKTETESSIVRDADTDINDTQEMIMTYFDDNVEYVDTSFYNPIIGTEALLRHFHLFQQNDSSALSIQPNKEIVIDDIVTGLDYNEDNVDNQIINVCVQYHLEELMSNDVSVRVPDSKGITFYSLRDNKIVNVFDVLEPPSPKPGNAGLELLEKASSVLGSNDDNNDDNKDEIVRSNNNKNINVVEKYFDAWNQRDMETAVKCFSNDCTYEDLQYDTPFTGVEEMEKHLLNVAKCLPKSFRFKIDKLAISDAATNNDSNKVGVLWHVENNNEELPFTRGCSFYTTTEGTAQKNNLILSGVDIPEPAVIKKGVFNSISKTLTNEPIRFIPATMWVAYMYIVFFSDNILPGANALQLEQRTWEEVFNLSLNFFLVSPVLNLPFAPVVHPMLEGVFNLLLAWAGMFAGFLADERKNKPNVLPFGPIVVGMQFLTSAFLLPYLAVRNPENCDVNNETVYKEDITGSIQATVGEFKPLGAILGSVGSASIAWAFLARPEFGDLSERYTSFTELLSIDRVGSSFLVDLAIFALFQGWFVDDDMKRRGAGGNDMVVLKNVAKFVPFFGLALYLSFRPDLPSREQVE